MCKQKIAAWFFNLVFLSSLAFASLAAQAAVPSTLNYQGQLSTAAGAPVNATVSMDFRLYDAAGNMLWSETQNVAVSNGMYSVTLGQVTPLVSSLATATHLGIVVATDNEMTPRIALSSVPFALDARTVGGVTPAQIQDAAVPAGFMILGSSPTPPAGYTWLGATVTSSGVWAARAAMPTWRYELAAAAINNKLYAVGGYGAAGVLATNEEYDPATNTWTARTPMPTARGGLAAAVVNNKLYAVGGSGGGGGQLATNEEYDPATDTWATKAAMPTARVSLAAAVANNKLYAVGGYYVANEEYDPATDAWTAKAPMLTARYALAAAVVNNKLYAVGGATGDGACANNMCAINEEYDPATDAWTAKAPMLTARHALAAAVVNNKLYAVGGGLYGTNVEEYDPATNTWTAKAAVPTARGALAAAVVNNKLYAVGGGGAGGNEEYDPAPPLYVHVKQ